MNNIEFTEKMIPIFKKKLYLLRRENNCCDVTRALMLEVLEETFIDLNWLAVSEEEEENQEIMASENEQFLSNMKSQCLAFAKEVAQLVSEELFNEDKTAIVSLYLYKSNNEYFKYINH